jgi:hypothetical protein
MAHLTTLSDYVNSYNSDPILSSDELAWASDIRPLDNLLLFLADYIEQERAAGRGGCSVESEEREMYVPRCLVEELVGRGLKQGRARAVAGLNRFLFVSQLRQSSQPRGSFHAPTRRSTKCRTILIPNPHPAPVRPASFPSFFTPPTSRACKPVSLTCSLFGTQADFSRKPSSDRPQATSNSTAKPKHRPSRVCPPPSPIKAKGIDELTSVIHLIFSSIKKSSQQFQASREDQERRLEDRIFEVESSLAALSEQVRLPHPISTLYLPKRRSFL